MNRIRRFVLGASLPTQQYYVGWLLSYAKEIKSLLFIFFAVLSALVIQNNNQKLIDIVSLYKIKIETPSELYSAPLVAKEVSAEKIELNVEEMISTTMTYSYSETQLGFYLKNFRFFNNTPKAKVERRILASLPKSLATNAARYVRAVLELSQKHQVDPIWVLSVMWTESHFDFQALSHAGARGLMQLMPATRKHIYNTYTHSGRKLEVEKDNFKFSKFFPYKINQADYKTHIAKLVNIELGIIYLKSLLKYFDRDHTLATVAYNMGPGWTRERLKNNEPVGNKNQYLTKVQRAYKRLVTKI